jgi:hypothetical protein
MALKLRPIGLGSGIDKDRPDYTVFTGEWEVGRIYETRGGPDSLRWFWSMTVNGPMTRSDRVAPWVASRKAYSWNETWTGSGEAPKAVCYQPLVFVDVGAPAFLLAVIDDGLAARDRWCRRARGFRPLSAVAVPRRHPRLVRVVAVVRARTVNGVRCGAR